MRGENDVKSMMFYAISMEDRIRPDHPLRPIKRATDAIIKQFSPVFDRAYAKTGRPSAPPEVLLRAMLSHMGHAMCENHHRLLMAVTVSDADGKAECAAVLTMLDDLKRRQKIVPKTFGTYKATTRGLECNSFSVTC